MNSKHEEKNCPRCGRLFECKVGNVIHCQCSGIRFTDSEKEFIGTRYHDCLCSGCLHELQQKVILFNEQFRHK